MLFLRQAKLIPGGFNVYFRCYVLHCGFNEHLDYWGRIEAWLDYRTGGAGVFIRRGKARYCSAV